MEKRSKLGSRSKPLLLKSAARLHEPSTALLDEDDETCRSTAQDLNKVGASKPKQNPSIKFINRVAKTAEQQSEKQLQSTQFGSDIPVSLIQKRKLTRSRQSAKPNP